MLSTGRPTPNLGLRRVALSLLGAGVALTAALTGALVTPPTASADTGTGDQWHLRELGAARAWQYASGAGVTVAVVDSGVDRSHPDLAGRVLRGIDLVDPTQDGTVDPVGHGTTVAGLIAGQASSERGIVGLAPDATILPVRVLDANNRYDDASIVATGVRWAVDHGASIINLSLGGVNQSAQLAAAIGYALTHDVVVVACTGNQGKTQNTSGVWYPARQSGVVAVAGLAGLSDGNGMTGGTAVTTRVDQGGAGGGSNGETLWSGSITGPETVLTAPAVNLLGARPGGYWRVQGTSFAAPLVSASAALIRSRWPGLNAPSVINRLIRTARDLGSRGRDDQYGFGEVDPLTALSGEVAEVSDNPLLDRATAARAQRADAGNGSTFSAVASVRSAGHRSYIAATGVLAAAVFCLVLLVPRRRRAARQAGRHALGQAGQAGYPSPYQIRRTPAYSSHRYGRQRRRQQGPLPVLSGRTPSAGRPLPRQR